MPRCIPRLIYVGHATWCIFEKVTNGRQHLEHVIANSNMLWCPLALSLPMHLLFSNTWWMMCFMSTWMILWFVTLMTLSFSQRTWGIMNTMYVLCWRSFKNWTLCKLEKCEFHQFKVEFLGYIISRDGICMDHHKVQTIVNWIIPASIWNVQCSFGFANFY